MPAPRSMAALTGIAVLAIALTACQDQASGQIVVRNGARVVETLSNPSVDGCHRFPEGVTNVENYTQSNLQMYPTPDCTGPSIYVDIQTSNEVVRANGLWRSFSFAPE
ncbi:hypothetical protein NX794_06185 [Streptomyces sp. LP11]|uniref:Lipoprotein n=1 Tax=Streptomyces pyxinicus TaxID=2970331 RepID=A0ABT2AX37_9ACTN|nr:hypothetical protein [Streptomyces sp. LP11]MCS0600820.1 hypothetical protein [Streptomyces sp. LP11]